MYKMKYLIRDLLLWIGSTEVWTLTSFFFYRDYFDRAADEYMFIKYSALQYLQTVKYVFLFLFFIWHL